MHSIQLRLSAALVAILLVALSFLSWQTANRAESFLLPEVEQKADTVGRSISSLVGRALEVGVPLDDLRGIDGYFGRILSSNEDFTGIALVAPDGRVLYSTGSIDVAANQNVVRLPVGDSAKPSAEIAIGLDPGFARTIVYKLWIDLAIVMFVTALVALELVHISFGAGVYGAIEGVENRVHAIRHHDLRQHPDVDDAGTFGQLAAMIDRRLRAVVERYQALLRWSEDNAARLADQLRELKARYRLGETSAPSTTMAALAVRAPLFVFMFAEELTRPFLPIYIQQLASPIPGLSPTFVISLPMVVFLAIVALTQPVLGGLTERYGRRRSLVLGAALGALGFCASAFATDLISLTLARAVSAVGFALVFVGGQGFVIDNTSTSQRARGLAIFIGAILVAGLCGPPIGGILADRLGIRGAFLVAAVVAALSLLLAMICIPNVPGHRPTGAPITRRDFVNTLKSPKLVALFFFCAMPAKIILVAFCFFLVPLQMKDIGHDQATIGRMLMIYPMAMVLLVPSFAALADRWKQRVGFVAGGGLVAGLAALLVLIDAGSLFTIGAMLLLLGIGQAMSIAPQSALVGELGRELPEPVGDGPLYGIFRLIERTGNALGPAIAGFLLGLYGFSTTVVLIGLMMALGALIFTITVFTIRSSRGEKSLPQVGDQPV